MGGLILDSTVTIRAERESLPVTEFLSLIRSTTQFNNVGLSEIGVTELFHGIYRADSTERAMRRRSYLAAFLIQLPVFDYPPRSQKLQAESTGNRPKEAMSFRQSIS